MVAQQRLHQRIHPDRLGDMTVHSARHMSDATVTSKGQLTIPADLRKALGLSAGERMVFTQLDDGTPVLRAKTRSILQLKGLLKAAQMPQVRWIGG